MKIRHCSVKGPSQKLANSNVERQLLIAELEHKHNDEIQMLKLQHALDLLQVEKSFTNWDAMRHINAINIRSFV